jgi:hypothetical protein
MAFLPNSTERVVRLSIPEMNDYYLDCFEEAVFLLSFQFKQICKSSVINTWVMSFLRLQQDPQIILVILLKEQEIIMRIFYAHES